MGVSLPVVSTPCATLALLSAVCAASASACGSATPGLRLNHAQVLASHNSYHVAPASFVTPEWNYTHPPLATQLERGIRAFELDVKWDPIQQKLWVMHVPGVDDGSTCETLSECLELAADWSAENPGHFPLFFQIEFFGGVKPPDPSSSSACYYSDVQGMETCVKNNCLGRTIGEIQACIMESCFTEALAVFAAAPACASLLTCLGSAQGDLGESHVVGEEDLVDVLTTCTSVAVGEALALNVSQRDDAVAAIRSSLDDTFPAPQRIGPEQVQADANGHHVWPEVGASRGKALFYLATEATWGIGGHDGYYFVRETGPVAVQNNPDDIAGVSTGKFVRTRVDEFLEFDATRQATALAAGAHVLSTDFLPKVGPTSWALLDAGVRAFWIPGGLPVRCNPVTAADVQGCSSLALEDPDALKCAADPDESKEGGSSTPSADESAGEGSQEAGAPDAGGGAHGAAPEDSEAAAEGAGPDTEQAQGPGVSDLMEALSQGSSGDSCHHSDVEPAEICVKASCAGLTVQDVPDCVMSNCISAIYAIVTAKPACQSRLACLQSARDSQDGAQPMSEEDIKSMLMGCLDDEPETTAGLPQRASSNADPQEEAADVSSARRPGSWLAASVALWAPIAAPILAFLAWR